jgi:hypothetical protein
MKFASEAGEQHELKANSGHLAAGEGKVRWGRERLSVWAGCLWLAIHPEVFLSFTAPPPHTHSFLSPVRLSHLHFPKLLAGVPTPPLLKYKLSPPGDKNSWNPGGSTRRHLLLTRNTVQTRQKTLGTEWHLGPAHVA